jgi:hypothetical protein
MHQHGPLFNYGPYYGYYPFKPYGPWDAYLRYDPFFYGDPYANFGSLAQNPGPQKDTSGWYGRNTHLHLPHPSIPMPNWNLFHHGAGCTSCGFYHASWLHGGWFRGHTWLQGSPHGGLPQAPTCTACKGVAVAQQAPPTGDPTVRYSGFGSPAQSAVYYPVTPALDPLYDLIPISGQSR